MSWTSQRRVPSRRKRGIRAPRCRYLSAACAGREAKTAANPCRQRRRPSPRHARRSLRDLSEKAASPWTTDLASVPPKLRVPGVAERITEQIEAEHRKTDRETGKDRQPRRLLHECAAGAREHEAPRRRRGLSADAQERQR